ncbi:hypothetical protein pb186bvf_007490 [Paramecium bursaria]
MNSTSTNSTIPSTFISIYFKIHYQTNYGQAVYLIGDLPLTGCWNPRNGVRMTRNEGDYWTLCMKLDRSVEKMEYKFAINSFDDPQMDCLWEPGQNRVVSLQTLIHSPKFEFFPNEFWGLRTIKLKLNHTLQSNQRMMIIGSLQQLGNWQWPVLMKQQLKFDILTHEQVQQWSYQVQVDPTNFAFKYYYVIRNDDNNTMVWERGKGRSLCSADLQAFRVVDEEFKLSPLKIKSQLYSSCQLKLQRNGSFSSVKPKRTFTNSGYQFNDKGTAFFYYEQFGIFNKLDWNFITDFNISQINEYIAIGPYPQNEEDILKLKQNGVQAILNLQTRLDMYHRGVDWDRIQSIYNKNQIYMINYEIIDMDPKDFIKRSVKAVTLLKKLVNQYEKVYVHCTAGIGRAPSIVCLYLNLIIDYELEEAIKILKQSRPEFYINKGTILLQQAMLQQASLRARPFCQGVGYESIASI